MKILQYFVLAYTALLPTMSSASVQIVTTPVDEFEFPGTGLSLREALNNISSSKQTGQILFDARVFDGSNNTITLALGQLTVDKSVFVDASDIPGGITIDANGSATKHRVLEIKGSGHNVAFDSVHFVNGNADGSFPNYRGGGIYNVDSNLSLLNSSLSNNTARFGGGVYHAAGSAKLTNVVLSGNTASSGGGIFNHPDVRALHLNKVTLSENSATSGVGLDNRGRAVLSNVTITGNSGVGSAGILNRGPDAHLDVINTTISGNTARNFGAGIIVYASSTLNMVNSIVAGNVARIDPDIRFSSGVINTRGSNLIGDNSSVEAEFPEGPLAGTSANPLDPQLAPLGHYGGKIPTMHPFLESPAIDAGGDANPGGTDARGFVRFANGALDIGAIEAGKPGIFVNTTDDQDNGRKDGLISLREAIAEINLAKGGRVLFDPDVFDGSHGAITLTLGQLTVDKSIFVDASNILGGVIVDANGSVTDHRVLEIAGNDHEVTFHSVHFTNGTATGGFPDYRGGGIYNFDSTVHFFGCSLANNSALFGGGIYSNSGKAVFVNAIVSGNSASKGGGIFNNGAFGNTDGSELILNKTTLTDNTAFQFGGGIDNRNIASLVNVTVTGNTAPSGSGVITIGEDAILSLTHSTISGNTASQQGAGIRMSLSSSLKLQNTIIAGNIAPTTPDIHKNHADVVITSSGSNLIGDNTSVEAEFPAGPLVGTSASTLDPGLAPLGHYGGAIPTMHPIFNSPVVDSGGSTNPGGTDARGFGRFTNGALDIGAVEVRDILVNTIEDENDGIEVGGVSLREAIEFVNSTGVGARVVFDPAVFNGLNDTITLTEGQLTVGQSISVDASDIPGGVIIDANGNVTNHRVLEVASGGYDVFLNGIHFVNGDATDSFPVYGGGIYNADSNLSISNAVFSGNSAHFGGGIHNHRGTVILTDSTFTGNAALFSPSGGGGGGGIFNSSLSEMLVLNNVTLAGNSATSGAGLSNRKLATLTNVTITGNSGSGSAGILSRGPESVLNLIGSTISGNSASNFGAGIIVTVSGTLNLENTIVAGNTAPNDSDIRFSSGVINVSGFNLIGDNSSVEAEFPAGPLAGTPENPLDPQLAPLGDYGGAIPTMLPLAGSPVIDAGGSANPGGTDARGFDRFVNGALDIGAVEVQSVVEQSRFAARPCCGIAGLK